MKWFVITNRERKSNGKFGDDPVKRGEVHLLSKASDGFPRRDKDLEVDYLGSSTDEKASKKFVDQLIIELKARAKKMDGDKKPTLLLYTHGYNSDYGDALEGYTQLRRNFHTTIGKEAFEAQCLPVLFSWPSEGNVIQYLEDRDDARASYTAVSNLVHMLLKATNDLENCISNIAVIAHSMGNYVFRESLSALMGSAKAPAGTFINQYIAIAADVGNTSLEPGQKGMGITRFCDRVSVYFSPHDTTLRKSKRKNGRRRLGRTLSGNFQQTPDNVVFIDCREWANKSTLDDLDIDSSVHSAYKSVPAILSDIFSTISEVDRDVIPNRERQEMNKLYKIEA